nr:hypothetical protein BaRGS_024792 [Batillaria attramentaria]
MIGRRAECREADTTRQPGTRGNTEDWTPHCRRALLLSTLAPRPGDNPLTLPTVRNGAISLADYRDPLSFYSGLYHQTKPPSDFSIKRPKLKH